MRTCPTRQHTYSYDVEICARDGARLAAAAREERKCPYCGELILKEARACKHCGHDVEPLAGVEFARCGRTPAVPDGNPRRALEITLGLVSAR